MNQVRETLITIYHALLAHYGPQGWWPVRGGGAWEVMMGAVLTQHTTWRNVEAALDNVERAWGAEGLTRPEIVLEAADDTLVELFRPPGFHSAKPRKLRELARFVAERGGVDELVRSEESTCELRERLLNVWGIGPETADAVLLYALGRPVFVADAYALRLASRWGLLQPDSGYDEVQHMFMENLPHDAQLFNEYHALIVAHGKATCRPRPRCESCPLNRPLPLPQTDSTTTNGTWQCPRLYV